MSDQHVATRDVPGGDHPHPASSPHELVARFRQRLSHDHPDLPEPEAVQVAEFMAALHEMAIRLQQDQLALEP